MVCVLGCRCGCQTLPMFYCIFAGTVCLEPGVVGAVVRHSYFLLYFAGTLMLVLLSDITFVLLYFAGTVWLVSLVYDAVVGCCPCATVVCRICMVGVFSCQCGCRTLPMLCCILQELYGWCPVLLVRLPNITYFVFYFAGTV